MAQSYLFLLAFVLAVALASKIPPKAHNTSLPFQMSVGGRLPGDYLVLRQNIVRSSSWLQNESLEQSFLAPRSQTISYVKAVDHTTDGTGGYVSLLYGGPGTWYVTLKFQSKESHDVNVVVEVYARP